MAALVEYTKSVPMNPLPFTVKVILTSDMVASVAKRKRQVGEHDWKGNEGALQFEDQRGHGIAYLFIPFKEADPGTIAHESYHAVLTGLRYVGSSGEEELVCYHLGHLVRAIHKLKCKIKPDAAPFVNS